MMIIFVIGADDCDDCDGCPLEVDVDNDHLLHNFQHNCDHFKLKWKGEVEKNQKYDLKVIRASNEHSN